MKDSIQNTDPEITTHEDHLFFDFHNDMLLLPEHVEENPTADFLAFGTSDDDLQF